MSDQTNQKPGNYYFQTIYPLVVLAVVFGLLLGLAYKYMGPLIQATEIRQEQKALQSVVQGAERFLALSNAGRLYYQALDTENKTVGYIFKEAAIGYGGPIVTLIGITNGVVENIFILNADQETPGLGYKCMEKSWQKKFAGLRPDTVPADKSGFEKAGLSAITGATLTSVAVTRNVSEAFKLYNIILQEQGGQNVR